MSSPDRCRAGRKAGDQEASGVAGTKRAGTDHPHCENCGQRATGIINTGRTLTRRVLAAGMACEPRNCRRCILARSNSMPKKSFERTVYRISTMISDLADQCRCKWSGTRCPLGAAADGGVLIKAATASGGRLKLIAHDSSLLNVSPTWGKARGRRHVSQTKLIALHCRLDVRYYGDEKQYEFLS